MLACASVTSVRFKGFSQSNDLKPLGSGSLDTPSECRAADGTTGAIMSAETVLIGVIRRIGATLRAHLRWILSWIELAIALTIELSTDSRLARLERQLLARWNALFRHRQQHRHGHVGA